MKSTQRLDESGLGADTDDEDYTLIATASKADVIVLLPARNEQHTVGRVVHEVADKMDCEVVVIDDASTDDTAHAARATGATVLPLPVQLGAWGATQTGIRYALRNGYRTVVTMDADGQHPPACISSLLKPIIANKADVVIGACPDRVSRGRRIAWSYFRLLTGLRLEDITSGFRAYNFEAMRILASAEASLLDYQDVGVLLILVRKKLNIAEISVPMATRTTGSSRVFSSWFIVGKYMLHTTLLSMASIGTNRARSHCPFGKRRPG